MNELVQEFIHQTKKNEYPLKMQISPDCIIPEIDDLTPQQHAYLVDRLLLAKNDSIAFTKLLLICAYTPNYENMNDVAFSLLDRILKYPPYEKINENHIFTAICLFLSQQSLENSNAYLLQHPELKELPIWMFRDIYELLSTTNLSVFQHNITKARKCLEFFYRQVKSIGTVSFCSPYIFFDVFAYIITSYSRLKNPPEQVSMGIAQLLCINPLFFYSFNLDAKPDSSPFNLIPLSTIATVGMPLPLSLIVAYQRIFITIYDSYLSAAKMVNSERMMAFLMDGIDCLSTGMAAKDAFAIIGRQMMTQQSHKKAYINIRSILNGEPGWPALAAFIVIGLHHNISPGAVSFISDTRSDLGAIVASILSRLRHENTMLSATYSVLDGIMGRRRSPGPPSITDMFYLTIHQPDKALRDHGLSTLLGSLVDRLDSPSHLLMFYTAASAILSSGVSSFIDTDAILDIVSIAAGTSPTSNGPCIRRNWRDLIVKQAADCVNPAVIATLLTCGLIPPRRFIGALAVSYEILRRKPLAFKQETIFELLKRASLSELPIAFVVSLAIAQFLTSIDPEIISKAVVDLSKMDNEKRSPFRFAFYISSSTAAKNNSAVLQSLIVPDFDVVYDPHHPAIAPIFLRTIKTRNSQDQTFMIARMVDLSKETTLIPQQRRIVACLFGAIDAIPKEYTLTIGGPNALPSCEESDLVYALIKSRSDKTPPPESTDLIRHAAEPLLWVDTLTMEGQLFPL